LVGLLAARKQSQQQTATVLLYHDILKSVNMIIKGLIDAATVAVR
jgi:hypothetical protein